MAGRPKHFEEEELIDRAIIAFWQKGYTATSAKDLLEAMEIGQGSFYLTFKGGKKELYKKSLLHFSEKNSKIFLKNLRDTDQPIAFIKSFFYGLTDYSVHQKMNGCYLGNALVELSNLDPETKIISGNLLTQLQLNFEEAMHRAQELGQLDAHKSPKLIASFLINFWNGINVTQRMQNDKTAIKELIDLNFQIIE
ncbi:TetR/AcrR family transcriptional regulator [Flavobacterium sp. 7A]|uniref:TetR/AcrR family transcriptional regulator n=1 Tax=Flavobacterium sp. 7A TaxID=2940571 RepID=UPI00222679F7|nr:TetR/AcrR family transcriptional regulator [Flavobacterium sp. 7A]MCW2118070.1 TetR/AcrR family transcriptional repressor of nem operon [Flavobacterium sp. 7A]